MNERIRRVPRSVRIAIVTVVVTVTVAVAGTSLASSAAPRSAAAVAAATPSDAGRRIVLAAPWPLSKADTDFYKMVILPDGFPGRKVGTKVLAHPIYGVYLIRGFLNAWKKHPTAENRAALLTVSRAAVNRMQAFHGGLAFWYTPGTTVTLNRAGTRAYSALTQAYYMDALYAVGVAIKRADLRAAAHKVFLSLLVPTSLGGVRSPGTVGPVLEEEPTKVPSAILNGWLSALVSLKSYAESSKSPDAANLLRGSAKEVARRLPRYDLPQYLGSSYSSLAYVRLRFDVPVGTTVRSAVLGLDKRTVRLRLGVGGQASDSVHLVRCGALKGGVVVATCSGLQLDVPVTAGGVGGTVALRMLVRAPGSAHLRGSVSRGLYRYVQDQGRSVVGWTGRTALPTSSTSGTYSLGVTASILKLALVPTTFKLYGGHRVNVYHQIHIQRLTVLAPVGGSTFTAYATKWRQDMCRWATSSIYRLIPKADLTCPAATSTAGEATQALAAAQESGVGDLGMAAADPAGSASDAVPAPPADLGQVAGPVTP